MKNGNGKTQQIFLGKNEVSILEASGIPVMLGPAHSTDNPRCACLLKYVLVVRVFKRMSMQDSMPAEGQGIWL